MNPTSGRKENHVHETARSTGTTNTTLLDGRGLNNKLSRFVVLARNRRARVYVARLFTRKRISLLAGKRKITRSDSFKLSMSRSKIRNGKARLVTPPTHYHRVEKLPLRGKTIFRNAPQQAKNQNTRFSVFIAQRYMMSCDVTPGVRRRIF